jgi:hypothetical protein
MANPVPEYLRELIGKCVRFNKKAEDLESYVELNVCGRITDIFLNHYSDDPNEQVFMVIVDFSEFDEMNRQFESRNYYDSDGNPTKNAREAGYYEVVDHLWVGPNFNEMVEVIAEPVTETIVGVSIMRDGIPASLPKPYRHHHLILMLASIGEDTPITGEQGFWTSNGRFVDRVEGKKIAVAAGQYKAATDPDLVDLYSEDLW